MTRYSFIIPAKNEEKYLNETLRAIQMHKPYLSEIIVVDNESKDRTKQIAEAFGAKVISSTAMSIAGVREIGAVHAKGNTLVFVDADTHVTNEVICEMEQAIKSGIAFGGGCRLKPIEKGWLGELICWTWNRYTKKNTIATGCFFFINREMYFKQEGFNRNLMVLEDIEFSKRLLKVSNYVNKYFIILPSHVYSSTRKLKLFTWKEHFHFWFNFFFNRQATITTRALCSIWYSNKR